MIQVKRDKKSQRKQPMERKVRVLIEVDIDKFTKEFKDASSISMDTFMFLTLGLGSAIGNVVKNQDIETSKEGFKELGIVLVSRVEI